MNRWVHVNAKTVAHTANFDVLIESFVVAILGQKANIAFAVGNLVLASRVVGHIGVRDVFNVPNHAVENVCHFNIGAVVHRNDFSAWAILTHVVSDLAHMLGQLVNRQRRPCVDRLTLHSAASGQYICWPLPLVVWATGVKLQIVGFVFTRLGKRGNRHVKSSSGG